MLKADFSNLSAFQLPEDVCFTANIGNDSISFKLPKLIARLMSNIFETAYKNDETIDHLDFSINRAVVARCCRQGNEPNEENYFRKVFEKMIRAFQGKEESVSLNDCEMIAQIAHTLDSRVLFIQPDQPLNMNNCCEILMRFNTQESADYVAQNIISLDDVEIQKLDMKQFEKVLKSEKLKVKSEKYLLDMLIRYIEVKGFDNIGLMSNVEIALLEANEKRRYVEFIGRALALSNTDDGFKELWSSVSNYVTLNSPRGIRYQESNDLQMVYRNDMKIEVSSLYYGTSDVSHNVEGFKRQDNNYRCIHTKNEPYAWVMWEFPQEVQIASYELECRGDDDRHHPRNWKIEVSLDKQNWEVADAQYRQTMLNIGSKKKYNITPKKAKYVRITQIGFDSTNQYFYFTFRRIKFAGFYPKK